MEQLRTFTFDNWGDQVLGNPRMVLVDIRTARDGSAGEGYTQLENLLLEIEGKVAFGVLDLSQCATPDQAGWIQESPTLVCVKNGRIVRHFSGEDRMARMERWLSLVSLWSPAFLDPYPTGI